MKYARVAVDGLSYAADRLFDYLLPGDFESILPGQRVLVPFGKGNRVREAMVMLMSEKTDVKKTKPVYAVLDDVPVLDEKGLKMAVWLRENCFCTIYEAVRTMLPAGLWYSLREKYAIARGVDRETAYDAAGRSQNEAFVLNVLFANGCEADLKSVKIAFEGKNPNDALKSLISKGIIFRKTEAGRAVSDKMEKLARLNVDSLEAVRFAEEHRKKAPAQAKLAELLAVIGGGWIKELRTCTGASMNTIKSLEKAGIISIEEEEIFRVPDYRDVTPAEEITLTEEQCRAFDGMKELLLEDKPNAALLYGVTGSGKTPVYIQLVKETLNMGKTALVLVPEIALTPGLMAVFAANFGEKAALMHSALRMTERYDEWKRIRSRRVGVVLGTRSAVFAPLSNLGLIIIDEEQENTYKSENNPRYHARRVAKYRCGIENALLVLGSATPDICSAYSANTGVYKSFAIKKRYNDRPLPKVLIADMKKELRRGNESTISEVLRRELEENIKNGRQSILFINRRGNSRLKACGECGEVITCPNCSVTMTWHSVGNRLMCHYCGHIEPVPERCPQCGGLRKYMGAGTQKVQEELKNCFPGTEILRMDSDSVSAVGAHEKILTRFEREKIPILLGTQMVTKGLDFENVTLVGVLAADLSLFVDDYRAYERTFSLITQVVGRAGRGSKDGRAVIQTYAPENEVIRFAANQDYRGFYASEIRIRRLHNTPPFSDMMAVTSSSEDEAAALKALTDFASRLSVCLKHEWSDLSMEILGPAPLSVAKVNNRFRYRLTLLCRNDKRTRALLGAIVGELSGGKASIYIDVDP